MAWAKFDDGYPTHPKVIRSGRGTGLALDVAGMTYAARHLTDGFIADGVLAGLYPPLKQPGKVAEHLVEVGRWEHDNQRKGWWIHDFLQHKFSAEATATKKAAAREGNSALLRHAGQMIAALQNLMMLHNMHPSMHPTMR